MPAVFSPALMGYFLIYSYSLLGRGIQLKLDYELPFTQSYDFSAFQYLFTLGCFGVLAGGLAHRGINSIKGASKTKAITIKK